MVARNNKRPAAKQAMMRPIRRNSGTLGEVWGFMIWLVGILVSLAVGFGMADGTLGIPFLPYVITVVAGWIVVVLTILGAILKIIDKATV